MLPLNGQDASPLGKKRWDKGVGFDLMYKGYIEVLAKFEKQRCAIISRYTRECLARRIRQ